MTDYHCGDTRQHQHFCENCLRRCEERIFIRSADEYWCPSCAEEVVERKVQDEKL